MDISVVWITANYSGRSDCEFLAPLFAKLGPEMLQYIDGMYAIVAYDKNTGKSKEWSAIHSLTYNDRSSQKGKTEKIFIF